MRGLKYLTDKGWEALYTKIISKALFAENNLSDLTDKEEARENLELTGDNNTTHYHDDRYLPLIQNLEDKLTNMVEALETKVEEQDMLSVVSGSISQFSTLKNGWYKWTGALESITATWIIVKTDTLYMATSMADPRIVLRSNDLASWYSPYAYWHA